MAGLSRCQQDERNIEPQLSVSLFQTPHAPGCFLLHLRFFLFPPTPLPLQSRFLHSTEAPFVVGRSGSRVEKGKGCAEAPGVSVLKGWRHLHTRER